MVTRGFLIAAGVLIPTAAQAVPSLTPQQTQRTENIEREAPSPTPPPAPQSSQTPQVQPQK